MKAYLFRSLIVVAALALVSAGVTWAHGDPVIAVDPAVAPAGGEITIRGTEMEAGEVFAITLEGPIGSVVLGEATATSEGEEAGFTATFTVPSDVAPGSYAVRAATDEGESAQADLTVTKPSDEASAEPAMAQEPSGEEHALERAKSAGETIAALTAVVVSIVLGFWLVRRH